MEDIKKYKISEECIKYLEYLEASPGWKPEVINLVRSDLEFGLSKEQVQQYMKKDWDIKRMMLYSECLRKGYEDAVISVITDESLSVSQCMVAVDYYDQGISIEKVMDIICNTRNAREMQAVFQVVLNKKKQLELQHREQMDTRVRQLEMQIMQKEQEEKASDESTLQHIPVSYNAAVMEQGKVVRGVHIEHTKKGSSALRIFMDKLGGVCSLRQDIVRSVICADLVPAQLIQIKSGIENGLTDAQLKKMIESNLSAEKMKEIIELAVLLNEKSRKEV